MATGTLEMANTQGKSRGRGACRVNWGEGCQSEGRGQTCQIP